MKSARFKVSNDLLASVLGLPKAVRVLHVVQQAEDVGRQFEVHVTHPELPEVGEGETAPEVEPWFTECDNGTVDFAGWGTDKAKAELVNANP